MRFILFALIFGALPVSYAQNSVCLGLNCPSDGGMPNSGDPFESMAMQMFAHQYGNGNFGSLDEGRQRCFALCGSEYLSRKTDCNVSSRLAVTRHYGQCPPNDEACGNASAALYNELNATCMLLARDKHMQCLGITGFLQCDDIF